MLTLDLTSSRNLSHALTGSRSRAGLVAAVITRKRRTLSYFHRCEKVVESKIQYTALSICQNVGVFTRRSIPFAPDVPRVTSKSSALSSTAIRQRGIVAD